MTKRRKDSIVEDIKHHFGFLFDKGYQLRDVRYFQESFGNWFVILESSKTFIRIDCDRNYISILFDPEKANNRSHIGLESLLYCASKDKHFVSYAALSPPAHQRLSTREEHPRGAAREGKVNKNQLIRWGYRLF